MKILNLMGVERRVILAVILRAVLAVSAVVDSA